MKRRKALLVFMLFISPFLIYGQVQEKLDRLLEEVWDLQKGEELPEEIVNEVIFFFNQPISLNDTDLEQLKRIPFLNEWQAEAILTYRDLYGPFQTIYELFLVEGLDKRTGHFLQNFVKIELPKIQGGNLYKNKVRGVLMAQGQRTLESAEGYRLGKDNEIAFAGDPLGVLLKGKMEKLNRWECGFVLEKDAGESYWETEKGGVDHYSGFWGFQGKKLIKKVILGDFSCQWGYGLCVGNDYFYNFLQGVPRLSKERIKGCYSKAETIPFRGVALHLGGSKWDGYLIGSYNFHDAVVQESNSYKFFSSLSSSGLHRTLSEGNHKDALKERCVGGRLRLRHNFFQLGFSSIMGTFSLPFSPTDRLDTEYCFRGKSWSNWGTDAMILFKGGYAWGEVAYGNQKYACFVGLAGHPSEDISMAFHYRNLPPGYFSFHGSLAGDQLLKGNEEVLGMGLEFTPNPNCVLELSAEETHYKRWRYSLCPPSWEESMSLKGHFLKGESLEVRGYLKFSKSAFERLDEMNREPSRFRQMEARVQLGAPVFKGGRLRGYYHWKNIFKEGKRESGDLSYLELIWHLPELPFEGSARYGWFQTDSYYSRISVYERNMPGAYTHPTFQGEGDRWYINLKWVPKKNWALWLRFDQTHYSDRKKIGEGSNQIPENHKTQFLVQVNRRW